MAVNVNAVTPFMFFHTLTLARFNASGALPPRRGRVIELHGKKTHPTRNGLETLYHTEDKNVRASHQTIRVTQTIRFNCGLRWGNPDSSHDNIAKCLWTRVKNCRNATCTLFGNTYLVRSRRRSARATHDKMTTPRWLARTTLFRKNERTAIPW